MARKQKQHSSTDRSATRQAAGTTTNVAAGKITQSGAEGRAAGRFRMLRTAIIFLVLMVLFYGFIHSPYVGPEGFNGYLSLIARVTGASLGILGQEITVTGTVVDSPDYSMRVVRGCDAIEPIAAFIAAVLASPISFRTKIPGILAGIAALVLINFIRLVMLFLIGVYSPGALEFMHFDVWQAAFIGLAICAWAIWARWATRRSAADPAPVEKKPNRKFA